MADPSPDPGDALRAMFRKAGSVVAGGSSRKAWFTRTPRPWLVAFLLLQLALIVVGYILGARVVLP